MAENERRGDSLGHRTTQLAARDVTSGDRARSGTPFDWRPAYEVDAVLGGRYRIVRFLARGGMGEVYEAEDLVLQMRVALKSIAPELVMDGEMIDRLKQEVLLARKVTHANVCRLHDLGFDVSAEGTTAFLTMDLLRGDTLAAHIARKGRLTVREALPIAQQLGDALDAAHEAGVIHRDFKTRNVMLVPESGKAGVRAVVMDFGIALAAEDEERRARDDGRLVGTPAYMAPEQMKGGEITRATDVYALGVVLFEMVTGTLPFEGTHVTDLISSRLTKPPPSPRARVRSLDRGWDAVIVKCLALEPANRFASVRQVIEALDTRRTSPTRARVAAGAGIALVLASAAVAWQHARAGRDATTGAGGRRPTLAVVMTDESGRADTRWIATALAGILGEELDADEALRVVPANRVSEARRDLAIADDALGSPGSLARLRDNLGADYVIVGRYAPATDGSLRVDVALDDARTGNMATTARSLGTTAKLFDLVAPLAATVRTKLGVRDPSEAEIRSARAATADDPNVMRAYAEGREKLDDSDFAGAMQAFERAVQSDPSFALAHDGLGAAAHALGYDARAVEETRTAFGLSHGLSREQQLAIEMRSQEFASDWDRATGIGRALVEFFPDNVDYGIRYAHALVASGRPKDALVVLDRLHALPPPEGADPRLDLTEAIASAKINDYARQLVAGRRAAEKAAHTGQLTVLADGHDNAGTALRGLHRPDEAYDEVQKAYAIYVKIDDRKFQAVELRSLGDIRIEAGDPTGARPLLLQSRAILRDIGERYDLAITTAALGQVDWLLGDDVKAHEDLDEARGMREAIHDSEGIGWVLNVQACVTRDDGNLARARELLLQARATLREVSSKEGVADATLELARISLAMGDSKGAADGATECVTLAKELGDGVIEANAELLQAELALDQDDAAGAKRLAGQSRAAFDAAHDERDEGVADLFLGRMAIDDARASDAEALARKVAEAAHVGGRKNDEVDALALLASALVAEKKLDDASATLDRAAALAPTHVEAQMHLAIARATMLAASPAGRAQATQLLAETKKRAQSLGLVAVASAISPATKHR